MTEGWNELKRDFCRKTARKGVRNTAETLKVAHSTLYRLIRGDHKKPRRRIFEAIVSFVKKET